MQPLTGSVFPAYGVMSDDATLQEEAEREARREDNAAAALHNSESMASRSVGGHRLVDVLSVAGCVYNMVSKGTIGVFETLGLVYVTSHYKWTSMQSGLTFSACGAVGVLTLFLFGLLLRFASDADLVLGGLGLMAVSCLMFGAAGWGPHEAMPLWEFYVAIALMYSVGYPVGHTALIGIFSRLKKSGPQGYILGLFGSAGSLARVVFPLMAGLLAELFGDKVIFLVMAFILVIATGVFAYFKRLVSDFVSL